MTIDPVTAELLAMGPFARDAAPYALVRLAGPDAASYLQRLCSQDVLALAVGDWLPAAFLDGKGKVIVTCHVGCDEAGLLIELQAAQQPVVLELLERYHFSEQLQFAAMPTDNCREVVQAAGAAAPASVTGAIEIACERRGVRFVRAHGAPVGADQAPLDSDLAECLRMAAGYVRVGVDTEPTTLALEADLEDHCSPTKGCYTGQEIVARIHTYGHTNRKLCFLQLAAGARIDAPAQLLEPEDQLAVGRVMHALAVPGRELRFGLGYLPRDFQAAGTRLELEDGAAVTVIW